MKPLTPAALALVLLLAAAPAWTQPLDLGPGISGYTRFLVYPHLQKGFEAIRAENRTRAYQEFEQALRLAPDSTVIAGYLADAYRRFGDLDKARRLLEAQLARRPDDAGLRASLAALAPTPAEPVASAESVAPAESVAATAELTSSPRAAPVASESSDAAPPLATSPFAPAAVEHAATRSQPDASEPTSNDATPVAAPAVVASAPEVAHARSRGRGATRVARGRRASTARPGPIRSTGPRPGSASAYELADAGYKASARGDFEAAARTAREAVRLAPDNGDYRRLLAYALLETGAWDETEAVVRAGDPTDTTLAGFAQQARQRDAYARFEAANRARADGDLAAALERARQGAELAPSNVAQQVQWLGALAATARWTELESAADALLDRPAMDQADIRLLRAHARQRLGRNADAASDYDRALAHPPNHPALARNARLIAADAALAAGQPERAEQLLAALPAVSDAAVQGRLREARAAAQRSMLPNPVVAPPLIAPKVVCVGSDHAPYCELWPGEAPEDPGAAFADAAVRAYGAQSYGEAVAQAGQAVERAPGNARYRLLYVRSLMASGQTQRALDAANDFLAPPDPQPELLALRSTLHHRLRQPQRAQADADAALADPRLSVASEIDLLLPRDPQRARAVFDAARNSPLMHELRDTDAGYLAVRVGDDAAAAQAFARAAQQGELPEHAVLDAGYASARLGRTDEAVDYFKRAVDAAEEGRLALSPQRLFETRREIADRSRTWGLVASLGFRGLSPGSPLGGVPSSTTDDTLQAGLELSWRPAGYRDGSFYELYGGGFHTPWAEGDALSGHKTTQAMLGLRVKPFAQANLVLAAERRVKIGSQSINDWLLRAGYSYTHGTDLRLDRPSWLTAQVYAEAGRFLDSHRTYATVEANLGRSIKAGAADSRLVLFPHVVLAADHDSSLAHGHKTARGAGVGMAMRYWFREDRYRAPQSYLDVSLQYRARLGGDARGKGVFLRLTLNY
ncbi:MAG TPA: tetratricopeptide repeat protein [Ottowia sp.]|uniref:NfrA family protein n=1 Tax=Ottowia sp. TaxID=1898956 RepID=UPI002C7FEB05|nr:tetratricopeptide repeat protein [Ottowia sp.]HMN22157.1 tetratricopeptide repeat protein [Ottowia sp.]